MNSLEPVSEPDLRNQGCHAREGGYPNAFDNSGFPSLPAGRQLHGNDEERTRNQETPFRAAPVSTREIDHAACLLPCK
jgi:hypothetical protein